MTSNQISAAGLEENVRHNKAGEEEIARHNVVDEDIRREQNAINQRSQQADQKYKEDMIRINEKYNDTYLLLQEAQADEKARYQKELNRLEQERNDITKEYNDEMASINNKKNDLTEQANAETRRHNEEMEVHNAGLRDLQDKQIEYQNTYWVESNRIADERLANELQKIRNDYNLGLTNAEINAARNLLQKEQNEINYKYYELQAGKYSAEKKNIEADTKLKESQKIRNYAGVVSDFIPDDISIF